VRRALPTILVALAAPLASCGGGDDGGGSNRVGAETLTVYASLPAHGPDARAGTAAGQGMRRALLDAGGRAGGRAVRLVLLSSTRPGDHGWDPGTVEANADRAAEDPSTIAYLGELDGGASAVSLPVTNRAQILQLSPADGLTSLMRAPPGRPRAGPERYYPGERRTFARLVEADRTFARRVVAELRRRGVLRLAIVTGNGIVDHELESMVRALVGAGQPRTVTRVAAPDERDDPAVVDELADELAEADPHAILYSAANGPRARAALAALAARLPGVPVFAPTLTRQRQLGADAARCARRLGHEAMRLTLAAIEQAGPDRLGVARAAMSPRDQALPVASRSACSRSG
jgi:branched-chain amino acid transport system substrate-binding protein